MDRTASTALKRGCSIESDRMELEMSRNTTKTDATTTFQQGHQQTILKSKQVINPLTASDASKSRSTSTIYPYVDTLSIATQTLPIFDEEQISEAPCKIQTAFRKSKRRIKTTDELHSEISLRRSIMIRSLFDEMKNNTPRQRALFFHIVRRILAESEGELARYVALQCRVHPAREPFSVMFAAPQIAQINSESGAVQLLNCIHNLSPYVQEIFGFEQLHVLQRFILRCLEMFCRKESVLSLAVRTIQSLELCEQTSLDFHRQVKHRLTLLKRTVKDPDLQRRLHELAESLCTQ